MNIFLLVVKDSTRKQIQKLNTVNRSLRNIYCQGFCSSPLIYRQHIKQLRRLSRNFLKVT